MSSAVPPSPSAALYGVDVARWAERQALLLREGSLGDLDLANLVGEIEGVGAAQRQILRDRMVALLTRLVMWKYQPGARLPSWKTDIADERRRIAQVLRRAPSLAVGLDMIFADGYGTGRSRAAAETGIDPQLFPDTAPFTLAQVLDDEFLPREPDLEAYDRSPARS